VRIVVANILTILLLAPSVFKLSVIRWWVNNREEIAATECINRFDASVMCGGHCILVKELSKIEQTNEQSHNKILDSILKSGTDIFICGDNNDSEHLFSISSILVKLNFYQVIFMGDKHCPALFIPPSC